MAHEFTVGSLVRTREREWIVLPQSDENLLVLCPVGGTQDEITGIYLPLEKVESASFALPDMEQIGDYRSCRFLRDAMKLGFRSSAGPFRCFGRIEVEPRPYQLLPLLMALKLDPVRLLIADDVGIGKTIEAALIARELLDRGEIQRTSVLCPPHLAEQWQQELRQKFHIEAELILSSTIKRLEKHCRIGQSIFELYPHIIVSLDFIKSDSRRDEFLRTCPEFVIVDEAHTCSFDPKSQGGRHQRFQLIQRIASVPDRHLILVTATPHSGKEATFRSLLSFLNNDFLDLPEDMAGKENEKQRRHLALHFIQRRRGDICHYLQENTPFPKRMEREETYTLSPRYKALFQKVNAFVREIVQDRQTEKRRQRVQWWSALALLRSLGSSPAAGASTLTTRAANANVDTWQDADEIGKRMVLDLDDHDTGEVMDIAPGCDSEEKEKSPHKRRLEAMAKEAKSLQGEDDEKLKQAIKIIASLVRDGYHPIVFCRFIPTAEYVGEELRKNLSSVEVAVVTGILPPEERERSVLELSRYPLRVLVCTDCLSEGINLQEHFDAVFHYDLSWNPTRHEQREGRIDRYGQPASDVRVVTYYGVDNQIDGIVLNVLLRKHKKIRSSLGISVPIPAEIDQVINALWEGVLLKPQETQMEFDFFDKQTQELHDEWENVAQTEKRSRTIFAQEAIKVEEVARELQNVRDSIGSNTDVASFMKDAIIAYGGMVKPLPDEAFCFDLSECPQGLQDITSEKFSARFALPVAEDVLYISRTHPLVESLASYMLNTAFEKTPDARAHRAGVIRTQSVKIATTLLLLRLRYQIIVTREDREQRLLAEDCAIAAFSGSPKQAQWLSSEESERLFHIAPDQNVTLPEAQHYLKRVIDNFEHLQSYLNDLAKKRGEELLDSHRRVRQTSHSKGRYQVEPQLPADVLGIYIYLPIVTEI